MNRIISMFLLTSIMMGCSTAYRSGQTPDDVYFSPAKDNSGYVQLNDRDEYRAEDVPMADRYLRMKSFGGSRWNMFDDDYAYWNNPHWNNSNYFSMAPAYGYGMGYNNTLWGNPYAYRNSGYWNPFSPNYYGRPVVVYNITKYVTPKSSGPRTYNLSSYSAPRNTYTDPKTGASIRSGSQYYNNSVNAPRGGYNPRSSGSDYGSPARTFSNSSSGSSSNRSSGTSSSSSSSSSSSGSSGSSSAPVRSFPRGGN